MPNTARENSSHKPEPPPLLKKFSERLFSELSKQLDFQRAVLSGNYSNPCQLWLRNRPAAPEHSLMPFDFQPEFVERSSANASLAYRIEHDRGDLYLLDASSVFMAAPLLTLSHTPEVIFDVCSAPGGKSIYVWALFHPRRLICNEVIRTRAPSLISNLKRCQIAPVSVVSNDPQHLANTQDSTCDLVIVDAPCSGQALIASGEKNPGCFHPLTIKRNANRQKRIIACAASLVRPGGYLLYTTCTYSTDENEKIIEWLTSRRPEFLPLEIPALASYQSPFSELPCFRAFPKTHGLAGGFTALLQRQTWGENPLLKALDEDKLRCLWHQE